MKIAVAVPAGLVLGLALGTFAGKLMAPPPEPPAVSADSAGAAESHAPAEPTADTGHAAPEGATPDVTTHASPDTATHAAPTVAVPPPAATKTPAPADHKRLASILDKLQAKDAAVLVVSLSDDELAGTLRAMDVTKAAELIGALPPARGAAMSKRMLESGGGH